MKLFHELKFFGEISSPISPHCGSGEEIAGHLPLLSTHLF